jgi:hypothetical protein
MLRPCERLRVEARLDPTARPSQLERSLAGLLLGRARRVVGERADSQTDSDRKTTPQR